MVSREGEDPVKSQPDPVLRNELLKAQMTPVQDWLASREMDPHSTARESIRF